MKRKRIKLYKVISVTIAVCIVLNSIFFLPVDDIFSEKADAIAYDFDTSGFTEYDAGAGLNEAIIQIAAAGSEDHFGEGRIILDKDYTENIEIPDNTAVEIDLNGHTISPSGDNARSNILVYGMLKLTDNSGEKNGALVSDGTTDISGIKVLSGGKLVFKGGSIRNYYSSRNGAGILVEENGFMSFNGGIVENCNSELTGGGVYVYLAENAEFVNGDINGNTAENGGGIAVYRVSKKGSVLTENMKIRNNTAKEYGGGLYVDYPVELNISNTAIEKNSAKNGGGIYLSSAASLNIDENSTVSENTAQNNGGGISFNASSSMDGSTLKVNGGKINGNTSGNNGGGVYFTESTPKLRHSVVLTNAEINDNTCKLHGGGLYLFNKTDVSITGTHVDRNTAARYGGGIYISGGQTGDNRCFFTMTDSSVCENTVDSTTSTDRKGGGAYFGSRVVVNLMSGEISRNTNSNSGGGFYANDYSEVNIHDGMKINENSCFLDNGTTQGSGCYLYRCTLKMDGGEICDNTSVNYGNGGGMHFSSGTAEITGGKISRNNVRGAGVGIFSNSMTYLEIGGNAVISENKNERTNESGGGIWAQNGPVEISGNALIENNENYNGGGVFVNNGAFEIRENAQIINNKARNVGGGVFHSYSSGNKTCMTMKGGKINNNTASSGGGIYMETSNRYAVNPSLFTGGEISGNTVTGNGGGMHITRIGWNNTQSPAKPAPGSTIKLSKNFVMEGNTANSGGAVYTNGGVRLELHKGGKITGNTANNNGGGIYIGEYSVYNRDYVNADNISQKEDESLTIYGGELHDNAALNGRDLYIYEYKRDVNNFKKPYFSAVKASSMDNAGSMAYWGDEISGENKTEAITNRQKINNDETPDRSQYTFNDVENATAKISNTEYATVQSAVNAIADGTAPARDIILIKSHRETVNIPDGVSTVLDLNGLALYGESASVITVQSGAELTVKDSSEDQTGMITDGKGTLREDNSRWGGGILCYGTLKVESGRITNNAAPNGSAIAVIRGTLKMTGGVVDNNRFDANALTIRVDESTANISNVVLKNNKGRGIYIRGTNDYPSNVVINNLKVTGHTGNNISSVYTNGNCTVHMENCEFTDNITTTGCGMIYADNGGTIYVKDSVIKNNQSGLGVGVYNVYSVIHLDNVTITDNYSTGEGGGLFSNWAGKTYFKDTRIYNNYASSRGNDLKLENNAWIYNETGNETDHRAVENLGMDDYNAWYDDVSGVYYVDNKEDHTAQGIEFQNISGDMVNPDSQRMRETKYLTAALAPDTSEAVAEIIETGEQYATLDSAFKAAVKSDEPVEIKLLKDVSENIIANKNGANITLDFNGHTVSALYGSTRVFYFRGVTVEFTDRTGGGKLVGVEDDSTDIMKHPRGIYLDGSKLTLSNVEISGFHYRGAGAALYCTGGYSQNGVFYNTEVYIRDGTVFKNNTAKHPTNTNSGYGGAIYFTTTGNCHNVFEMTGGSFINNSAYRGGAIYFALGTLNDYTKISIKGGLFEGNDAQYYGGAVYFEGSASANDTDEVTMYGFTMRNNSSYEGGAIYGRWLTNSEHTVILGDENENTVFDRNTSRSNYAAVYIYTDYPSTKGIDVQNIEIKNNYSASNYIFYISVKRLHAWNLDAHDNEVYGSEASLTLGAGELLVENCKTYNNSARLNYGGLGVFNPSANNVTGTKLVKDCESYNNTATNGSGGYCSLNYDVTLENLDIHNNFSRENGGYYLIGNGAERTITVDSCHFHDNNVLREGGGIYCSGFNKATLDLKNTIIENNESGGSGGGFWIQNGSDYIIVNEGTEIRSNKSGGTGGGIYNKYANLELRSGKITGNQSVNGYGGGVYWYNDGSNSYLKLTGSEISNNTCDNYNGGGICIDGYCSNTDYTPLIELSGGSIINNSANNGGGVFITGNNNVNYVMPKLRITGTLIKGNYAKVSGGGLFNNSYATDTVISDDAVITENTAGTYGGGVYVESCRTNVRLEGGKLFGNKASSGNDAFISYHASYRSSNLYLYKASEMFGSGDEYKGLGWIDETTSAVNTEIIKLRPLGRSYPYTLSYRRIGKVVAVYNGTEYTSVTDALDAIALTEQKEGEITLVDDDVESITIDSGLNVKLNLNGHTLKGGGTSTITNRGTLEIIDDKKDITVGDNHYAMTETVGTITGTSSIAGGGISVKSGSVVMSGGQISECFAGGNNSNNSYGGGAVIIEGGQFVLKDGVICDNIARNGAAVFVKTPSGVFTMYGGEIRDNKTSVTGDSRTIGSGGAIYNRGGTVNIIGGTIKGNSAYQGGAIYNLNGNTNIIGKSASNGPVIENNVGGFNGGGVYIHNGILTTGYCKIVNNSTSYARHTDVYSWSNLAQGAGGGIYIYSASANISNGTVIKGNTAIRGGALYQINGTVLISGSETVITANKAQLGGGCAQSPLPGNSTTVMTLTEEASVYENKSVLTASGNDFYSAWEGTNTYEQQLGNNATYTPRLNLIAALDMAVSNDKFNVWKSDNYKGTNRTGIDLVSGQFVTAEVNYGRDIQITAAYYETEAGSLIDSNFAVINFEVGEVRDGKSAFDDGKIYENIQSYDAAQDEKTALQLLQENEAVRSEQSYYLRGREYKYIEYNGKLYEENQMVSWHPGDDSSVNNKLVRSFDDITYVLNYSVIGDPPQEAYTTDYHTRLRIRAVLHCSPEEASFDITGLSNAGIVSGVDERGNPIQTLTGYWSKTITPKMMGEGGQSELQQENVVVKVYSMKNGSLIKPEFEMWFEGNNHSLRPKCNPETVTVSAAPKYNVSIMSNPDLCRTIGYDKATKSQISRVNSEDTDPDHINCTVTGFGITLQLYNDPSIKGLKGIEIPKDEIEFDLSFKGRLYGPNQKQIDNVAEAPILWAYKENNNSSFGRDLDTSSDIIEMSWDDVDMKERHSHFAYSAAPYNSGGDAQSCYDGGGWVITRSDKTAASGETKLHVKVSGFKFNNDNNPVKFSGNVESSQLSSNAVKAFSAGYVQMLLPFSNEYSDSLQSGYYQLVMDAVVSNLDATSVTGQIPDNIVVSASNLNTPELEKADIDGMNEYYNYSDPFALKTDGYAVNERRYFDNYSNIVQAFRISNGGSGNAIGKTNLFCDSKKNPINGVGYNDNGLGETPLNSTVYIRGAASFSSAEIDTGDESSHYYALTDPLYNSDGFELTEYNYLTALNLLQKFDADVYTVTGTVPIIKQTSGKALTEKLGDNFSITTDESETTWSNTATKSYELTILYAAKRDGSNWVKEPKTDTSVDPIITYDDGGAADMVKYREENLLYFKSLDDLHIALGVNAKCVAILYQFRNCVFRTERSVTTYAKANVTGDFHMVGDTYCTTNDVRGWYTYRPYYKLYFADKTVADHTYQYNWTDWLKNPEAQSTDPEKDDYEPATYGAELPPSEFICGMPDDVEYDHSNVYSIYTQDNKYPVQLSAYTEYYIKTRYRNGVKLGGTHNGMDNGNSLLLYSLDTSIDMNVETRIPGSETVKDTYTITNGERDVQYRVTPHINIASGVTKTELTRNGTQSTEILIEIKVPKHLTYITGSLYPDYTHSDYEKDSLVWDVSSEPGDEGTTIIKIKTFVSDIDKVLPELLYDCKIGDEMDPDNDIKESGTSLVTYAEIKAKYSETNRMAAETHSDMASINILKISQDGISESIKEHLVEIGEDIEFIMTYANSTSDVVNEIQAVNVLPHIGDGRGTEFNGGYRLKKFILEFASEDDCSRFINDKGELLVSDNDMTWAVPADVNGQGQYFVSFYTDNSITKTPLSYTVKNEKTLEFDAETLNRVVTAYDASGEAVKSAPALYAMIPRISGGGRFNIRAILSPTDPEDDTKLISSGTGERTPKTQIGGNEYHNSFIYRKRSSDSSFFTPISSNTVAVMVISRSISGVAWMDQNHDGLYNTKEWVEYNNGIEGADKLAQEYPIADLKAVLYKIVPGGDPVIAKDVLGNPVKPAYTDDNGKYLFENIPPGNYTIVFGDDEHKYRFMSPDTTVPDQPVKFTELSVTSTSNTQAKRGNKFLPVYDTGTDPLLKEAKLNDMVINMPEKNMIPSINYNSSDWNIGLYFQDITVHKTWENMIYGIPDGTKIIIDIKGREQSTQEPVYSANIEMTNSDGDVKGYYTIDGGTPRSVALDLDVEENDKEHTVIWNLSDKNRLYLRAENKNGVIDYAISERKMEHYGQDASEYYNVFEDDDIDAVTKNRIHNITNNQILGSITITKETAGNEALQNAEFSIYQVNKKGTPGSVDYYGSKSGVGVGVGDTLTAANRYMVEKTKLYNKVRIGDEHALNTLKQLGMYNAKTNTLTITNGTLSEEVIVHKEGSYYYYNTSGTLNFSYEKIIGTVDDYYSLVSSQVIDENDLYHYSNGKTYPVLRRRIGDIRQYYITVTVDPTKYEKTAIVQFDNLPLYNIEGERIYYTVRETNEPDGYISLGNFKALTGVDLYNGGPAAQHDFSYLVVNNKQIELPLTGSNTLALIVITGTVLITLGALSIFIVLYRKKNGRMPGILQRLLE